MSEYIDVLELNRCVEVARSLRTDDDSNPEYDRALVEMTTRLLGISHDNDETIATLILGDRAEVTS